eukprot:TRINITY_DN7346_c0_g1_i1.p1 TRINITY_DN7346_c0_g1~~TRINITY_DN7346_c0_g1_i1.p1  ORF type:complete len:109 (+),score=7.49 TRINITY_DN7346_c0_g1_i1:43-327(+)
MLFLGQIVGAGLTGRGVLYAVQCFVQWDQTTDETTKRLLKVFEAGAGLQNFEEEDPKTRVHRPELQQQLLDFLHPEKVHTYGVFFGVNGRKLYH